ncbi:SGNH/GDSL hydrolase family protein [Streptomyces sp. NPDC005209]|uniref:SGNH/GDSL hydrolase family protein n=1 Tax=Streptomyces sp. NPDC005209 TaxID=3156715 RepID=UPI0033B087F0
MKRPVGSARHLGAVALACLAAVAQASVASATPASAGGRNYVALGDSHASAPGVPEQTDPGCGRSSQNYPSLVARQRYARLTDVTCAGATTASLALAKDGRPARYDALNRDTDLVTVSIGGNDGVGFSAVLTTCATLSRTDPTGAPCRGHYTEGGGDRLLEGIATTAPKVDAVLATVHRRAPHAKVLLVGYPSIFPDDGTGCTSPAAPFAAGDFGYLRDTTKALNAMLARRAELGGAVYVDTYTSTVGHDMCRPAGERWIENLAPAVPANAGRPTARGEQAMAEAVERALKSCHGARDEAVGPAARRG